MNLREGVGALVVRPGGDLLLLNRRADDLWSLPGGAAAPGESLRAAIARELLEETGLRGLAFAMVDTLPWEERGEAWTSFVFLVTRVRGRLSVCEPHQHTAATWHPLEHLPHLTRLSEVIVRRFVATAGSEYLARVQNAS